MVGGLLYERGGDARRKFKIKPLRETNLGVAKAILTPKRDHYETQTNIYFLSSLRAALNDSFTAIDDGVLPRKP